MKRIIAAVCIITTILGFGPGAPSTLLASGGPCKKLIYVPTIKTSCICAGVLPAMCPGSWDSVDGYYTCGRPGDLRVGETECKQVGDTFACSMSYNWAIILSCALGSAVCWTGCSTAVTGVGIIPCLACISVLGKECVGCSIVSCTPGTVGTPIMGNVMTKHGGYCPPGTTID